MIHILEHSQWRLSHLSRGVNRAPNFKAHLKKPSPSPLNKSPIIEQNIWGQAHSKIYLFVGLKKPHYKGKKKVFFPRKKKVFFR